jgi:hypothetical protein
MREAQKQLPEMVESWKQCCRLSREVHSDEVHSDPENRPQNTRED